MGLLARKPALGCLSGWGLEGASQCPGSWGTAVVNFRKPQTLTNHWVQSPKCWSTRPVPGLALARERLRTKTITTRTESSTPLPETLAELVCSRAPECVSLKFSQVILVHRQITESLNSGPVAYLVLKRRLQWPCQSPVCN